MARDTYHQLVVSILEKDGWSITHDPLLVKTALANVEIDLGAQKLVGALKNNKKIAVEIKSFIGNSKLQDLYQALGQYGFYYSALRRQEPDRVLYLAVPLHAYDFFFKDPIAEEIVQNMNLRFLVYSKNTESIISWTD